MKRTRRRRSAPGMQEVTFTVKFTTACLGHVRGGEVEIMPKDSEGRVIFMNSWWQSAMRKAAKAIGCAQSLVPHIQVHPVADGPLGHYDRPYATQVSGAHVHEVKRHEAFLPNTEVAFRALVPHGIDRDSFVRILTTVGDYYGISPYGHHRGFGRFVVSEVNYGGHGRKRDNNPPDRESAGDRSSPSGATSPAAGIPGEGFPSGPGASDMAKGAEITGDSETP